MKSRISALVCALSALSLATLSPSDAGADDTEIFFAQTTGSVPAPNLLIILDNSVSMASGFENQSANAGTESRLEVAKQAIGNQLAALQNTNVGLMVLNADQGGRIVHPVSPIHDARPQLRALLAGIQPDASAGLSETLFEAYNYWAGLPPRYAGSAAASQLGANGVFNSPLSASTCALNHIIYIAGSTPTDDTEANLAVTRATGFIGTDVLNPQHCSGHDTDAPDGVCLDDIAKLLRRSDLNPATAIHEGVTTHVIALPGSAADIRTKSLLQNTADAGGGTFVDASNAVDLREALNRLVAEISVQHTAPAVSAVPVQFFNQARSSNEVYFAVFQPTHELHWPGNLKKFRIQSDGTIIDADNHPAIDASGTFVASARSYWSQVTDGASVALGGAASRIPPPSERKVYTDAAVASDAYPLDLRNSTSHLTTANGLITPSLLGLDTDHETDRADLIGWIRGGASVQGAMDGARHGMGDPLHAKPALVSYNGTAQSNHTVVFVPTNDGYLHAIDGGSSDPDTGGNELWSFIPASMLGRMAALRDNAPVAAKGYGLDGTPTAHRLDRNEDGLIDASAGDRVYLFFGMGRGGSEYYALDVSDKESPRVLWRRDSDDMPGLGQSWSTPVITRVRVGNGARQNSDHLVVLVGGGYDAAQDNVAYQTDSRGNRLYMLDALSGDVLWYAGPAGDRQALFEHPRLTHSVPSALRVIDLTGDGYADRMYAADTGGQVWRFDIHNGNSAEPGLVTGGVLASVGTAHQDNHPIGSNRRFFNTPDISLIRAQGRFVMNVAIGSGYRAHPLDMRIEERFYSLHDSQPFTAIDQATFDRTPAITESQLQDVTTDAAPALTSVAKGWMMRMSSGEKVLSDALTFEGRLLFTTFTPTMVPDKSGCTVPGSRNRLYTVYATDGRPAVREAEQPLPDVSDRYTDLKQGGIAGTPFMLFPDPESANCTGEECAPPPVCLVGTEQCGTTFTNRPVRTHWMQRTSAAN